MYIKIIVKWGIAGILFLIFAFIYKTFNPLESYLFPKCPFFIATNLKCPGCGSQRAIHYLLNFNIQNAMRENFLLVIFIPYLIIGFILNITKNKDNNPLQPFFGLYATYIILFIIVSFWIIRNIIPL